MAAVFDPSSSQVWVALAGPSNPRKVGPERAGSEIDHAVTAAIDLAGAHPADVRATVMGIAGSDTPIDREQIMRNAPASKALQSTYATNDVALAWASGTYCEPGVAIISGTGSNTFGVNERGQTWRVGGFDYMLGDEGSGFWLGVSAMKAALRYRDGRGRPTLLAERILKFYGVQRLEDLSNLVLVTGSSIGTAEVAAFAREVTACAEDGDEVSLDLLRTAARDLARQVNTAIVRLQLMGEFPVAMVGSVWNAGAILRKPFEAAVMQVAPQAAFVRPDLAPVGGAILLAARAGNMFGELDKAGLQKELAQHLSSE